MEKTTIMLKIGVILHTDSPNDQNLEEIGRFLASDLYYALENGEDWVDTKYLGCEIVENP